MLKSKAKQTHAKCSSKQHQKRHIATKTKKLSRKNSLVPSLASSATPLFKQKRTNYSFINVTGPKDTRYLDYEEEWVPPKAKLFDNTLVYSSMILERPPICLPLPPAWEVDWYHYRQSKLSENAWVLPKDLNDKMYGKHTVAQEDFPEPMPHITKDDINNDRHSLYRALDEPLFLICKVKQDFNPKLEEEIWMFPTTEVREGENVRTAAERTLFYHAGDLQKYTLGNSPTIYHENELSSTMKKDYPQATKCKNFYMHAMYLSGKVELEPDGEITDYAWVKQSELAEYFTSSHNKELLKLTNSSLYYLRPE